MTITEFPEPPEDGEQNEGGGESKIPKIDLNSIRLNQDFDTQNLGEKVIDRIPVRKPHKTEFFRVRPESEFQIAAAMLEVQEGMGKKEYLLNPSIAGSIGSLVRKKALFVAINREHNLIVVPVNLPDETGRLDTWSQSRYRAVMQAMTAWVRIEANMNAGGYDQFRAREGVISDPVWPDLSMDDIVNIAFRDLYIDSAEHPILLKLKGEA